MRQELWNDCDTEQNADDYRAYVRRQAEGNALTLLAFNAAGAIGFIEAEQRADYVPGAKGRPIWYVEGIFVESDYRRHGIGSILIRGLAERVGATEIASDCEMGNEASRLFHEAAGFQEVGRSIHFWMSLEGDADSA